MGSIRFTEIPAVGAHPRASFAGAESNVAIGVTRLGHQASWIGTLGDDVFGGLITRTLRGEGVDLTGVRHHPTRSTGLVVSRAGGLGTFAVDYFRAESAGQCIDQSQVEEVLNLRPRILHVTGITPALGEEAREATRSAVAIAKENDILVSFDVNFRSRLWSAETARPILRDLAQNSSIVFGGEAELKLLTDGADAASAIAELHDYGVAEVVWKESLTATTYTPTQQVQRDGRNVPVVDTIGAGDAFVSGYLSGILDGLPIGERLERAHVLGAFGVGTLGDWEGAPSRGQLAIAEIPDGEVNR